MVLKEENQGREPAIQEIACVVATVFKRVSGTEPLERERTNSPGNTCYAGFLVSDKILEPINNYLIQCRFN